jgi:LAO/AO transport system kinase
VARHSREAIAVMEAAGYDIVIVETVGVGQSETMVAHMVDALVVLALPGAGDELQGIKRGVLEWADLVAVTKADGAGVAAAERARAELERALRLYPARDPEWTPPVLACSAVEGRGIDEIWQALVEHRRVREHSGGWARQRSEQRVHWMWQVVEYSLLEHARGDARFAAELARVDPLVRTGALSPDHAAKRLLACVDSPGPTAVG